MKRNILMIAMLAFSALAMVSCKKDENTNAGNEGGVVPGVVQDDALFGVFTINENDAKINFSRGNLYYDGSDFNFEENQYDFAKSWNENHISHFMWSADKNMAISTLGTITGSENDIFFTNKADFAVNGQTGWRTLSNDEWNFLINLRRVNGESGYGHTCIMATVNDVDGLIIFPDGYDGSVEGLSSIPEGCAFLPNAGDRMRTLVRNAGYFGKYWLSTPNASSLAYGIYFKNGILYCGNSYPDNQGLSVRLVRDVE